MSAIPIVCLVLAVIATVTADCSDYTILNNNACSRDPIAMKKGIVVAQAPTDCTNYSDIPRRMLFLV